MVEDPDRSQVRSKRKAISALFPFAVFLERSGRRGMVDLISRIAKASGSGKFMWYHVEPFIIDMFNKPNPPSLNWILTLISPCLHWQDGLHGENTVAMPATAASTVSHSGRVDRDVVDRLLRIAFLGFPRPPQGSLEQPIGTGGDIRQVRALGDIGILKSYLIIVWSEWGSIDDQSGGLAEMQASIRENFSGIGMGRHRRDLVTRLDHIIQKLHLEHNPGFGLDDYMRTVRRAMGQYMELKGVVLEVGGEAVNEVTRKPLTFVRFGLLTPANVYRIPCGLHVHFASPVTTVSHCRLLSSATIPTSAVHRFTWSMYYCFLPRSPCHFRTTRVFQSVRTPLEVSRWMVGG